MSGSVPDWAFCAFFVNVCSYKRIAFQVLAFEAGWRGEAMSSSLTARTIPHQLITGRSARMFHSDSSSQITKAYTANLGG
jgi:hypothetical protein